MKKKTFFVVVCVIFILLLATGCNNSLIVDDGGSASDNNTNVDSKWGLQINGKSINLPCKLSTLENAGVYINDNYILETPNKIYTVIHGWHDSQWIFLKIEIGSNTDKKSDNATVKTITNNKGMQKDLFVLKNGIGLGSTIDDVISTFGSNYIVDSSASEDLHKGFVMTHYGDAEDGLLLWYQDGILNYIEIYKEK